MATPEEEATMKALIQKQHESRKADLASMNSAMHNKQKAFNQTKNNANKIKAAAGIHGIKQPPVAQAAAQNRFKGKYAGPDRFKGVIPEGYKGKAKGKYFGKDSRQGANVPANPAPDSQRSPRDWIEHERNLPGNRNRPPFDPNNPGASFKWRGSKPTANMIKKYKKLSAS